MNRVSTSALDLLASALAAMILLYIVTLKETLLYPKSVENHGMLVSVSTPNEGCQLGLFYVIDHEAIWPTDYDDKISIYPRTIGAYDYQAVFISPLNKPLSGKIVIFLHHCSQTRIAKTQHISIDLLGAIAVQKLTRKIEPQHPMIELDLARLSQQQINQAWSLHNPQRK